MKKIMKLFVLVAAAAMTLASCQKNEISGPVTKEVHFTINAGIAETKTTITDEGNKKYTPKWESGDKIGVLFALEANAKAVDFENTAGAGAVATFEGKHAFTVEEGATEVDGNLYAFYPSSAFEEEKKIYSNGEIRLDLKATQNPTSTSFDPSCDLLIAKPCYYMAEATGESVEVLVDDMYFARMMSVLRINLNSEFLSNEIVKSVSFAADGVDFTGAMRFNLETGEFVGNQSASQDLSEVKAVYSEEDPIYVAGEKNSAYLVVAPVTIPSGTTLTFTIETENYDIVKTVTDHADMVMPAGNIAVINLTIAAENCTAKTEDTSDYSGTYAIIAENSSKFYYLTNVDNDASTKRLNSAPEMTSLPESGVKLDASLVWNIVKNDDGTYLIQSAENELYLDHTSGNSSVLVANVEEAVALTIKETQGKYAISYVDSNSEQRNFVKNSSNPYFAFYTSEQCGPVYFVPAKISMDPTIIVADEDLTQSVDAEATELSFNYQVKNISGVPTVKVDEGATTMTIVEAKAEAGADAEAGGTVTVTFDANAEEEEKTATLVLSYEGAESVSVTITQAAKAAEGGAYYEKVTSALADWSGEYLLVYEDEKYLFDGSLTNVDSSPNYTTLQSISDRLSFADYSKYAVTIEKYDTGYSVKTASGLYIGRTSNSNGFNSSSTTQYANTISFTSGKIKIAGSGGRVFNYNSQSGKFRFFASTNAPLVSAYKLVGGNEGGETPADPVQLIMSEITCSAQTENSLTFNWTAVANATGYEVTCNNKTETVNDVTYTATGLTASTQYTISVKAVGDGTNYTTSEAKTHTGTTTAAQGGGDAGGELVTETLDITGTTGDLASDNSSISWEGTYFTCINEKASSTTAIRTSDSDHYRVYVNSKLNFSAKNGTTFNKLVLTCISGYVANTTNVTYPANLDVDVSGTKVTITCTEPVSEISLTIKKQIRISKVEATLQ